MDHKIFLTQRSAEGSAEGSAERRKREEERGRERKREEERGRERKREEERGRERKREEERGREENYFILPAPFSLLKLGLRWEILNTQGRIASR
ncbi:hypothetical protein Cal6303_2079 [Calothrix sp. PCC 6303]|nr:hypothetical protein Cal6303_2079 [Calothrix sp. PCC 6303]